MNSHYYDGPQRKRRNRQGTDGWRARRSVWWQVYRARMDEGLEPCRRCGTRENLTFDHIIPFAAGGRLRFDNATILCQACNRWKLDKPWRTKSLAQEEREAPESQRWFAIERARAYERPVQFRFVDGPLVEQREDAFGLAPQNIKREHGGRSLRYELEGVSRKDKAGGPPVADYRLVAADEIDRP